MSERDGNGDGLSGDGAPDFIPPRVSRGRRSGVILPGGGQDADAVLLESVKAAPRRSSIIKVFNVYFSVVKFWLSSHIWLFLLVSSQLISQLIDASCRQRVSAAAASLVQPRRVILSVRVA
ncbi:hypothetical protein EYF80_027886 [Liparis tanakae]|uniref:Uncharacterized protein n=1 Tax=Liparis tanakae TaxID=230148 RepID=A0A4Z2H8L8_9TELE|nr:hypothetical protein EYF80_027886 [Liparis tanakae]